MTPPVDDPETLRRILMNTDALLLDFDGPICSVFAGIPASVVAVQLRGILAEGGYTDLPADVRAAADPFEVLFYAAKLGQDEARYVEAAFRAHEVEAVQSAEPTPGAVDLIEAWTASGRRLAIVSNNSSAAVEAYLHERNLDRWVDFVSARTGADVSQLKPSPALLSAAAKSLRVSQSRCVLVGDSVTDVEACRKSGVIAIGFANRKSKVDQLLVAGARATVTNLSGMLAALSTQ